MIGLLQRVTQARVEVAGETLGAIGKGLLALIGIERNDQEAQAERLLERLLGYRIFSDPDGKMNLSLTKVGGGLLLVPQFTLPADTKKGMRPNFTPAASPEAGACSLISSHAPPRYTRELRAAASVPTCSSASPTTAP